MPVPYWQKRSEDKPELRLVYNEVRGIAATWFHLRMLQEYGRGPGIVDAASRLESAGSQARNLSDAKAWRLTIEIVADHVDKEVGSRNLCLAAFSWLLYDLPYRQIFQSVRRPVGTKESPGDLVDRAIIAFWSHVTERQITEEYRTRQPFELATEATPGADVCAARAHGDRCAVSCAA